MRFSDLTAEFAGAKNRLYERLEALRAAGVAIVDLVDANVNEHGIVFPADLLKDILAAASPKARIYRPVSLGQDMAREAIAGYAGVSAGNVLLTPGTSVSYWYAFKLLCEPGDEILCPAPSYPLFDYIARLAGVEIRSYHLDENHDWEIRFDSLEHGISPRTRAIVLISPHNPTGMVADRTGVDRLATLAARHQLAIIADEVFREFVDEGTRVARPSDSDAPLVFTLNGFSKMFALPGMKIGWMAVSGERKLVERSMRTLEMISDTFLPVNETAQFAVSEIFGQGQAFLADYRAAITRRRQAAVAVLEPGVPPRGGFHMVVPFNRDIADDDLAMELLETERILVHPGYFYDVEGSHIVMATVSDEGTLQSVLPRVRRALGRAGAD